MTKTYKGLFTRRNAVFHTIRALEEGLKTATLVSDRLKPPARENMDSTRIRIYTLWEGAANVSFLPFHENGNLEFMDETHPEMGTYKVATIDGVRVYCHNNTDKNRGSFFHVRIMMRTWEPEGAEGRSDGSGHSFRNYEIYLDVLEACQQTKVLLNIFNAGMRKTMSVSANMVSVNDGVFSHLSNDQKRSQTIIIVSI